MIAVSGVEAIRGACVVGGAVVGEVQDAGDRLAVAESRQAPVGIVRLTG